MSRKSNPLQKLGRPMVVDDDGAYRFRHNSIVRKLMSISGMTLEQIERGSYPNEDLSEFARLLGMDIKEYVAKPYVNARMVEATRNAATKFEKAIDFQAERAATELAPIKPAGPLLSKLDEEEVDAALEAYRARLPKR